MPDYYTTVKRFRNEELRIRNVQCGINSVSSPVTATLQRGYWFKRTTPRLLTRRCRRRGNEEKSCSVFACNLLTRRKPLFLLSIRKLLEKSCQHSYLLGRDGIGQVAVDLSLGHRTTVNCRNFSLGIDKAGLCINRASIFGRIHFKNGQMEGKCPKFS